MISMKKVNYAAIDIGSNAVRLLIKCVNEENAPELMSKVQLIRIPLRLGEDAFTMGVISAEKEKKLIRLMKRNGKDIARQIARKTGIRVDIIDGQEEAHIVYDNHIEQLFASGQNYLYVDVGGGSTEINLISNGELKNSRSYNIGTVRMLSGMVKEEEKEALRTDLIGLAAEYAPISIIGSGGNINKLFRLADKKDKKASLLPVESLREIYEALQALPAEQRIKQYKLKPDRADVIVPAAEIFLEVAMNVKATGIIVPTIGLSDGIIDSLYTQKMNTPVAPKVQ